LTVSPITVKDRAVDAPIVPLSVELRVPVETAR
jgi:hypothetical protein